MALPEHDFNNSNMKNKNYFLGTQMAHKLSSVFKSRQYNYHCKQGLECTAISNGTKKITFMQKSAPEIYLENLL